MIASIQRYWFADYIQIASESTQPQSVTQNDCPFVPWLIFIGKKRASSTGCGTKHIEEIGRHGKSLDALRVTRSGDINVAPAIETELVEYGALLFPIGEIGRRNIQSEYAVFGAAVIYSHQTI